MLPACPYCTTTTLSPNSVKRSGFFWRKSDGKRVQRLFCHECKKGFSFATFHPCLNQKKRHKNEILRRLLASGISQRRVAKALNLSRTTVVRKFIFLSEQAKNKFHESLTQRPIGDGIVFDDLETFEHTKCKPLAITLVVEKSRRIVGFRIAKMNAKGRLAKIALKKYGRRRDERKEKRRELFAEIKAHLKSEIKLIESDENPHYKPDVEDFFPEATYQMFKGVRGSIVGQGELKKVRFDPLFSLNHTCAMLRYSVNRLARRTWCTTKKPERLARHIYLYLVYHNENLKQSV